MRQFHSPVWLDSITSTGTPSFVALFVLDAFTRSTLITVVPLQALALLGNAQRVSVFYLLVSVAGLLGALSVPWLVRRLRRRWVTSLSVLCLCTAAPLLASQTLIGLTTGLALHMVGAAMLSISLNLYVLDHIRPKVLTRFEPMRMLFTGTAWMVGPVLGVYLGQHLRPWAPYATSAGFSLILLSYFWFLRMTESPILAPASLSPANPLRFIGRFFSQPRLVLAWFLSVGRGGWWMMFFIYTPIYAVTSGLDAQTSGWIVTAGASSMFVVTFWGRIGRRYGLRRLMIGGYLVTGLLMLGVGIAAETLWLSLTCLLFACFAASAIDGAGNVPFLRAVRAHERPEMTTVFSSYRDVARLTMPGLFALVLTHFSLPAVFVTSGMIMLVMAFYARHIPRSL